MNKKVVWITGCASGVGLYLAESFCLQGYKVIATDINYQGLKAEAARRQWPMDRMILRKLDVRSESQWRKLLDVVVEKWGRLDTLLNVAGYLKPGYIDACDADEINRHIDINTKGVMFGSKVAAEQMVLQGKGHIINIASLAGVAPIPGIALYSASKFAVRGFTLALAQELKPKGVAVTAVCPDAIETPMLVLQEDYDEAAMTFSGKRFLTVEDIRDAIFDKVLPGKPIELTLPASRGWTAKLASMFPGIAFVLGDYLRKQGQRKQKDRKKHEAAGVSHSTVTR